MPGHDEKRNSPRKKTGPRGSCFSSSDLLPRSVVMMMVVMMVMVVMTMRHHHDVAPVGVMMVMVVMMTPADADDDLGLLDVRVRGLGRSGFVDGLQ